MQTLFTFLMGAAGPLVLRALAALGVGVVTFAGVDTALTALISQAQSSWAGLSADVLGLAGVAGIPAALGVIAGAMVARVTIWVGVSATRWLVKGS
jgi:hypothetical protein